MKTHVLMISDGTGITVESLGNSLLTQFESINFERSTLPYIDTVEKAAAVVKQINTLAATTQTKPLVFMTLVNPDVAQELQKANATLFDLFNTFLGPLEIALHTKASDTIGKAHGMVDAKAYDHRIEAINYAMAFDDGIKTRGFERADIILIGVSRCGKTPSCLYMALQFGILAANYPITEEDLSHCALPECLRPFKKKLFGLTIAPERLQSIRCERRPNSRYASLKQCQMEINAVEAMYVHEKIPYINSTYFSIEEITTKIMAKANLARRI